jgi:hypothetical protein
VTGFLIGPSGVAAAAAPGGSAALTYRGGENFADGDVFQRVTYDLGAAAADRVVIVKVSAGFDLAAPTVKVGSTAGVGGTTLTQDVMRVEASAQISVGIFSGVVSAGSGSLEIDVNWPSGAFIVRSLDVWTATGLGSTLVRTTTSFNTDAAGAVTSGSNTLSATASDFMIIGACIAGTTIIDLSTSTQVPSTTYSHIQTKAHSAATQTVLATNASFQVSGTGPNGGPVAVATYR